MKCLQCKCVCWPHSHIFESTGGPGRYGGGRGQRDPAGPIKRSVRQHSAPHRRVRFRQQLVRDGLAAGVLCRGRSNCGTPSFSTYHSYFTIIHTCCYDIQGFWCWKSEGRIVQDFLKGTKKNSYLLTCRNIIFQVAKRNKATQQANAWFLIWFPHVRCCFLTFLPFLKPV